GSVTARIRPSVCKTSARGSAVKVKQDETSGTNAASVSQRARTQSVTTASTPANLCRGHAGITALRAVVIGRPRLIGIMTPGWRHAAAATDRGRLHLSFGLAD